MTNTTTTTTGEKTLQTLRDELEAANKAYGKILRKCAALGRGPAESVPASKAALAAYHAYWNAYEAQKKTN